MPSGLALALTKVAEVLAQDDPSRAGELIDRAERVALAVTDAENRVRALVEVAAAVKGKDPWRAGRLAAEAERAALAIMDEGVKACALASILKALPPLADDLRPF